MKNFLFTTVLLSSLFFIVSISSNFSNCDEKSILCIENIEALSQNETTMKYYADDWEDEYFKEYRNGSPIYVVCGGRNCYADPNGDLEKCYESYYEYEEER